MKDPLDQLKEAFDQATPTPDAARKADALARAEEIFESLQGSPKAARQTNVRPKLAGLRQGVRGMFASLTTRPALTVTTALVAVGLVAVIPALRETPANLGVPGTTELAPVATDEEMVVVTEELAREERADIAGDDRVQALGKSPLTIVQEPAPAVDLDQMAGTVSPEPRNAPGRRPRQLAESEQAERDVAGGLIAPAPQKADVQDAPLAPAEVDSETFANEPAASVKVATQEPVSTFSVDVDTASYSIMRSSLMNGQLPNPDSIRVEEMVNYFPYDYAAPGVGEGPFRATVSVARTPWNPDTRLLHIGLQGQTPDDGVRPPLNIVFLIDTSGSMNQPNKLPLLKQSFRLMLGQLSPDDEVSIVTYAGSAGRVLDPTPASDRATILAALNQLDAGGSTAGQAGLQQAYATAEAMATEGEVTRVILATDGDFNVGLSDPGELEEFIAKKRDSGTYLSVLGFGRGNLDDATMQALAQNGNGQAAYIDTLAEAQKVLVDQLSGALFPIANDVKIQVEFNPTLVAEYRLIGFETRALNREDFNNDLVDAGEVGAGHQVTALYEVTPVGSPAVLNDPLRYGRQSADAANAEELAFLRLRYKRPGEDNSQLIEVPILDRDTPLRGDSAFAAAIAGFGQVLRDGLYTGNWNIGDAISLAEATLGDDPFGYRREAVQLMRLANSLSQ